MEIYWEKYYSCIYKESGIETSNGRIGCTSDKINSHDFILVINYWSEGGREDDGVYISMSVYTLAAVFVLV